MQGQHDPAYEAIVKAISAIIFLSTPHRGTNLAEILNRILQVSFVAAPMHFIAELSNGSQTLQKLNEQFRHIAPRLQIVSFYETRPTAVLKKTQFVSFHSLFCIAIINMVFTAHRWSWRKSHPCSDIQARCRNHWMRTTTVYANTKVPRIPCISLLGTYWLLWLQRLSF